ncbi:hypothetical protein PAECIP111892_05393 [Paenibacillus auburnensis]|uniref:Uncharacterized protein n=2 Tax=Paenibacillus auburnensis TaxID=2905649 RepID=A0ABN8H3Q8_9BACL|nr:hypothetical protein PAECIP111892_05393 [Paenibacillus auburnensis]
MGLHLKGFILPLLVLLPNLLLIFFAPHNIPKTVSPPFIFTVFERVGQVTCFTMPILFGTKIAAQPVNLLTGLMFICLIIYYLCWIRFFWSGREFAILFKPLSFIPIPMALFPILYFILLAVWLNSYLFAIPAVLFAIGHFVNSWSTFSQTR